MEIPIALYDQFVLEALGCRVVPYFAGGFVGYINNERAGPLCADSQSAWNELGHELTRRSSPHE